MKAIFIVLLLVVVGVIALGFYQGWWTASSNEEVDEPNVEFKLNKEKMQQDKAAVQDKVKNLGNKQDEATDSPTGKGAVAPSNQVPAAAPSP